MPPSRSFIVLAWGLLLAPGAGATAPEVSGSLAGVRRIELRADEHVPLPEVHISPGFSTTVFFDSPILPEQVELEGRERFRRVGIADDHLALIPSGALRAGERLRLQVRYRDGALPEFAALMLVVGIARVEHQVELYRRPRPAESYRQEMEELKVRLMRLQREVERLRGARVLDGGIEAVVASISGADTFKNEKWDYQRMSSSFPVLATEARAISLSKEWAALRLTLVLAEEGQEWTATGASLVDAQGRAVKVHPPWQPGPVRMKQRQAVVVLLEDAAELEGAGYTLKLWDEGGRTVTFEGAPVP